MARTGKTSPRATTSKVFVRRLIDYVNRRSRRHKERIRACRRAGFIPTDLSDEIAVAAGWKRKASIVVSDGRVSNGT